MNTRILSALIFTITMAPLAHAQDSYPEDGWWWNSEASGRGYFIERQQDFMFIAAFNYTVNGEPEFLTSQGFYTPDDTDGNIGAFSGEVYRSSGLAGRKYIKPEPHTAVASPGRRLKVEQ